MLKTRRIYARKLLHEHDFFHLANEFYRYIFKYPELESDPEWKLLKDTAEDLLVKIHLLRDPECEMSYEEYREFLRFYIGLETKYHGNERKFIFTEREKKMFMAFACRSYYS